MFQTRPFRVLVATDGSRQARAAVTTAVQFPWPTHTRVRVVVARTTRTEYRRSILLTALDRSAESGAPDVRCHVAGQTPKRSMVDNVPVTAMSTRRLRSVSRRAPNALSSSSDARSKSAGLCWGSTDRRLQSALLPLVNEFMAPPADRVILVTNVDTMAVPSHALVSSARSVAREVKRTNTQRRKAASRELNCAAARLTPTGWSTVPL